MSRFLQKLGFGTNTNTKNKQIFTPPRPDFIRTVQDPRGVPVLPVATQRNQPEENDSRSQSVGRRSQQGNLPPRPSDVGEAAGTPALREAATEGVSDPSKKRIGHISQNQINGGAIAKELRSVTRNPSNNADVAHARNPRLPNANDDVLQHSNQAGGSHKPTGPLSIHSDINKRKSPPRRQRSTSGGKSSGTSPNTSSSRPLTNIGNQISSGLPIPPVPAPREKQRVVGDSGNVSSISPDLGRINIRRPNSDSPHMPGVDRLTATPTSANRATMAVANKSIHTPKLKPDVVILSEYSDPADFKRIMNEKIYSEEDYTEPYELQKLKKAFQSQNLVLPVPSATNTTDGANSISNPQSPNVHNLSKLSDKRPVEEYDAPWEYTAKLNMAPPVVNGSAPTASAAVSSVLQGEGRSGNTSGVSVPSVSAGSGCNAASEGAQPQTTVSDGRPLEEYDTPWEWQAHKNTDAAAAALATGDGCSRKRSPNLKLTISPQHPVIVDASIPLQQQKWYHGAISRSDAEDLLKSCREGSFLVRQSESNKQDYSLSLKSAHGFMHMKIVCESPASGEGGGEGGEEGASSGQYVLGQYSSPFASIPHMISFYTEHKLPIRGAEHMSLLHPVNEQLL